MLATITLALTAVLSVARAQITGDCNPSMEGSAAQLTTRESNADRLIDCKPSPAIGRTVTCDFTKGKCDLFKQISGDTITYDENFGAQFIFRSEKDAPALSTDAYMFFGRLEVELKAAPGPGLATSLLISSDYFDEIDTEWLGSHDDQLQSSISAKGDTETKNRNGVHAATDVTGAFHNYTIVWNARSISWSMNGQEYRVEGRNPNDKGDTYPQTPAKVRVGIWAPGSKNNPDGTIEWAGGLADLSGGPVSAWVRRVTITDFGGGDDLPEKRVKQYEALNRNGTYQSIKVVKTDEDNKNPAGTTEQHPAGTTEQNPGKEEHSNEGLSFGAIIGIVVGSIAVVLIPLAVALLFWRRKRRARDDGPAVTELHGKSSHHLRAEMDAVDLPVEMSAKKELVELEVKTEPVELEVSPISPIESGIAWKGMLDDELKKSKG